MVGGVGSGTVMRPFGAVMCVVSLFLLTACAPAGRPDVAALPVRAVSSPSPTERDGDTDDTSSKVFVAISGRQDALEHFDEWVREQPGVVRHGFIATVDDPATTSVTLLWFGTDPWRNRLVAAGSRAGVHVRFQQRARSLAAFTAAQQRLVAAGPRFRAMGFTTVSISGISAEPHPLTMTGSFTAGADRAALRRLATRIAGQPVLLEVGSVAE